MNPFTRSISRYLIILWIMNCALASLIAIRQVWIPYMNAWGDSYMKIIPTPFDGTVMPIAYIPDWTKVANQDKIKKFEDISISEFLPIPLYDPIALLDSSNPSKSTTIIRYTYFTPYMWSYKLDYKEYAWSHLGVDIRAPIGTPILSIAHGVITRVSGWDNTWDKYIVIRHDGVMINGTKQSVYSSYLHLSEILVKEGDIVKKWDMIGRVGMTGITTTPHLHFQIDTSDAPFHPYWPFSSSDAKSAGVWFYDGVNIGLGRDKAVKYTIHPMTFVNMYLGGVEIPRIADAKIATPLSSQKTTISTSLPAELTRTVASYITESDACIGKRFADISDKTVFADTLYSLVDKKCLFSESPSTFGPKEIITYREALINTMRYFDIAPAAGTSHFLDIAIGDVLQGYAQIAYRKGILDGNYAYPEHIMTREEVAILITKIARAQSNPSQIRIYADVDPMNSAYQAVQDYGFMVRARGGRFYPKTLASRSMLIQMLANIK